MEIGSELATKDLGQHAKSLDLTWYVMGSQQKEHLIFELKNPHTFESKHTCPHAYKPICTCVEK